jgi:hypothetical protein
LHFLFLTIFLFFGATGVMAAGETVIRDLKNTKIIHSQEKPHNILNEACIACHPKEKFDFWILIYKGNPPTMTIDRPEDKGTPGATASEAAVAPPKNRFNSHDSLACSFCHLDNPTPAAPKFIVDIQGLCRLCHPAAELHNLPDGEGLARVSASIASSRIPGREGKILCTTCHKLHDSTYGMREAYARILWQDKVPDPHGNRMFCFTCHPGRIRDGEEVKLTGGRDNIRLCNDCHLRPGIRKAPHVVDIPSSEGTWRMDYLGYPLSQGKLICSTCHDEVSHRKKDPANPNFLRGGPYADAERFCYRCHLEDRDQLNNPHRQVDPFGKIREESCRFCHKKGPDPSKRVPGNLEMVADEAQICTNCHQLRPHPGVNHLVALPSSMLKRKEEYEKRHQVTIPLREDGAINCSTCHNPHAKGVLKGEAGVGAGSRWRVPDFREVCAPCHGRY